MSKHTNVTWKVGKPRECLRDGNLMYGIIGSETVSDYEDWGFTEADARLISAAPELLEALKAVRAWDVENFALDIPLQIRRQMQAAIAKATGETK